MGRAQVEPTEILYKAKSSLLHRQFLECIPLGDGFFVLMSFFVMEEKRQHCSG